MKKRKERNLTEYRGVALTSYHFAFVSGKQLLATLRGNSDQLRFRILFCLMMTGLCPPFSYTNLNEFKG